MALSPQTIAIIRAWADTEPLVKTVYLFGSQAKGTATAESDVDLALELDVPDEEVSAMFVIHGPYWQDDLQAATGLQVNIAHLAGDLSPIHNLAVADHGIKLWPIDAEAASIA